MYAAFGILVLRLVTGLLIAAHGAQKLFGWFGGYGLKGTSGFFAAGLHLRHAGFWAAVAALAEVIGGLLLAAGLANPVGPMLLIAVMLVAIFKAHWAKGLWVTQGGYEYPLVLGVIGLALAFTGPGPLSLDALLATSLPAPQAYVVGIILAGLGAIIAMVDSERAEAVRPAAQTEPPAATRA